MKRRRCEKIPPLDYRQIASCDRQRTVKLKLCNTHERELAHPNLLIAIALIEISNAAWKCVLARMSTNAVSKDFLVVVYEDRPSEAIGVKLLLASLARHQPDWLVRLVVPNDPDTPFNSINANVQVDRRSRTKTGWDVKPALLIEALSEGYAQVLWLDSDLLLTRPISPLEAFAPDQLILAEEPKGARHPGSRIRTHGWGFEIGRDIACDLNTCVIGASQTHVPLLKAWSALLYDPRYVAMQTRPWSQRPQWFMGDQDALSALLGSQRYANQPLGLLREGRDIAQCFNEDGFAVRDRLAHAFKPLPPLVHAQGAVKPWHMTSSRAAHVELSPYRWAAQTYASVLHPHERQWLTLSSRQAQLLNTLTRGDAALAGLPHALWRTTVRKTGRAIKSVFAREQR